MDAVEPVEGGIRLLCARVFRMVAMTRSVSLPDLDKRIGHRVAGPVAYGAFYQDRVSGCLIRSKRGAVALGREQ